MTAVLLIAGTCYAGDVLLPSAAGTFYPDNAGDLLVMISGLLDSVDPPEQPGEIFALIVPHAGYGYSGKTAAYGYKLVKEKPYRTVIVIGSAHRYGFSGVSVYPEGAMRTPLGDLQVDSQLAGQLTGKDPDISYVPQAFAGEHSVEVQLPFLQMTLYDFKIVPIVMGDCTLQTCKKLAGLLKEAIGGRKDVLVVASTDMYHGYSIEEAQNVDKQTVDCLKKMDPEALYYGLREGKYQLCGGFGVVTTLALSRQMDHDRLDVLDQTNSAIVTGRKTDGEWTVGYVSCAIDEPAPGKKNGGKAMLNKKQRERLLSIARRSIETYLEAGRKLEVAEHDPVLNEEFGAFVTLHEHGQLRGCIGNIIGRGPLYLTVRDMAVESATGDPRFPRVTREELKDIDIEISVLSKLERVDSAGMIVLGKHGCLVKKGHKSGVFLPQVATETGWTKEEFLSNLCAHKAGLPADAWKDGSCELYVFCAEVFSEKEPGSH